MYIVMPMEASMESYSIASARSNLPSIVHDVERGAPVTLTRRGRPVAMIVSISEYERMARGRTDLWEAIDSFRSSNDLDDLDIDEVYRDTRDRSPGRTSDL